MNQKELLAALQAVKTFASPGDVVKLSVDNSTAFWYLKKGGGKLPWFNEIMRDLWSWLIKNQVHLQVELVPSAQCLADPLSRIPYDHGDYSLEPGVFNQILVILESYIRPQ